MWEKTQKRGGQVEEKKEENKGDEVMVPWIKDTKEDDRSSIGTERFPGRSDFSNPFFGYRS